MPRDGSLQAIRKKLSKVTGNGNLESLAKERSAGLSEVEGRESLTDDSGRRRATLDNLVARNFDAESSALRKLQNGDFDDITPREQGYLEAIVEEDGRPVAFVIDDQFDTLLAPWTQLNADPVRSRINAVIPSIGRIEDISGGIPQHIGTGFVVGPNLMMTNRHVAEAFVRGTGRLPNQLSFIPGIESAIDFRRENELDPNDLSTSIRLTDVVMVHPYWDMALFRVDGLSAANGGLRLSIRAPEDLVGRNIVVIGSW